MFAVFNMIRYQLTIRLQGPYSQAFKSIGY
jgi:hypothetical protein